MNWLQMLLGALSVYLIVGTILGAIVFVIVLIFILKTARYVFNDPPKKRRDKRR